MIIRGNTVSTTIAPEKIAEKIGDTGKGRVMIVTIDEETGKASSTAGEILAHVENRGSAVLYRDGMYIPFSYSSKGSAEFNTYVADQDYIYGAEIFEDGSYAPLQTDSVSTFPVMVVDLRYRYDEDHGVYFANYKASEISEWVEKGYTVFGLAGTSKTKIKIPLTGVFEKPADDDPSAVIYTAHFQWDAGTRFTNLQVTESSQVVETEVIPATSEDIGDITAALEEIREYAQGLINGGATE